jgi:predicted RNA-binding protein Jag
VGTVRGDALGEVGDFLLGVVERIDLGPFEIARSEDGELLVFELRGIAARALAGGDGRSVDALQLLVNQAATKADADAKRIVLDVEGNTGGGPCSCSRPDERP